MFNQNCGYSLADVAAATGGSNGGMWGGDGAWWIILLFLFAGGWGTGNGNGRGTVREEIAYGFDMNGLENSVRGIQQGLCDGFYAMNTGMLNGFAGVNSNITNQTIADMQNTNAITSQITSLGNQLASCCCNSRYESAIQSADLNYRLAEQSCQTRQAIADSTTAITANQDANTRAILDFLTQDKIASLTAENQSLKFAASQVAQNNYLVNALNPCPIPAYQVPNPYKSSCCC